MAATAAAVAAEEDTELRDLLVQTLEGSGVLNRIKVGAGPGRAWRRGARAAGPVRTAGVTKGPPGRDPGSGPWGGAGGLGVPGSQVPTCLERRAAVPAARVSGPAPPAPRDQPA